MLKISQGKVSSWPHEADKMALASNNLPKDDGVICSLVIKMYTKWKLLSARVLLKIFKSIGQVRNFLQIKYWCKMLSSVLSFLLGEHQICTGHIQGSRRRSYITKGHDKFQSYFCRYRIHAKRKNELVLL